MQYLGPLLWFIVLTTGSAIPLARRWDDITVKHAWSRPPKGWDLHHAAPSSHRLDMRIGLKQNGFEDLVGHLYQISDPTHQRYGQHLSKEEVEALVAPHANTINLVHSWLSHHGIELSSVLRSPAGNWLSISMTVEQAKRILDAKYSVYKNVKTGSFVVRTESYSLPTVLHDHIDVVAPTTYFGGMGAMGRTSFLSSDIPPEQAADIGHLKVATSISSSATTIPDSCSTSITPICLTTLYNTTGYIPSATNINKLGVAGYLNEFANTEDLTAFFGEFFPDNSVPTFQIVQVNGGLNDQSNPGREANLDIQYTEAISFPTPNIYFSTGGSPPFIPDDSAPLNNNEPYLDWLTFILNQTSIPQTFSTSYGDDEQTVPIDYATSVCNMFAQLGVRGSSILFSSGDGGVGGFSVGDNDCISNDGTGVRFQPVFPASCPYVTSVGGTSQINPEIGGFFSGGGFSNYFAQPHYQSTAVNNYLASATGLDSSLFNVSGRAFPDVAAQGLKYQVIIGGIQTPVSGTSASTPTVAGIVSLLNDFRIANGQSPLGFLNPLLYSSGAAGFNDITIGSNPGCGTNGFPAATGWDPITGFGTPDFGKLQSIVRNA